MAIRKEDWPSIHQAIADAITPLKPKGWRKALFLLREWSVLGALATLIVALLGIAGTAFYQATARIGKEATFETNTKNDLKEIRSDIKAIREDLAKQGLFDHASLPLPDFKATLPDLRSVIAAAKQQGVQATPKVIDDLQKKLIAVGERTPGFWPTAAEFISYR